MTRRGISIKTREEIDILKDAGRILASIVKELTCSLKSGLKTKQLNAFAEFLMEKNAVTPAFRGYRGYPSSVCVSVNDEVVHGIPSDKILNDGDIVSLDVGIIHKGYYSDMAITQGIGNISIEHQRLIDVTREALFKGIEKARQGNRLGDVSYAIQKHIEANRFSVVREFVGHGIGRYLHEEPEIPNFGEHNTGPFLKQGMVFAIEPMVNMGTWQTKILDDKWTVVTKDGKPSAHFEHTVLINNGMPEILTQILP